MNSSRATGVALVISIGVAACAGDGSEIGPSLPRLPSASSKVQVLDDSGRGVADARVEVGGIAALTNRNGRAELFANPRGRVLVAADGANGAAVAADRLGSLRFASTVVGRDLGTVIFLPAYLNGASANLTAGTQASQSTVQSSANVIVRVPSGSSVGVTSGASTVTLRVAELQASHVPGDLPTPAAGGTFLSGRVVCIDPPGVTFTPGANLDIVDDLGLGAVTATLFELDATTGEWTEVRSGLTATAGRVVANGALARSGTYVLACAVASTSVSGRVVDAQTTPQPVSDVIVAVDGRRTVTAGDGTFTVSGVPALLANGNSRAASIELFAGGDWLPVRRATTVAVTAGAGATTGDLVLDTVAATNVRMQQIRRGRADSFQPARLSATFDPMSFASLGDDQGQVTFEDVPSRWYGFQEARPLDDREALFGQGVVFTQRGRRNEDLNAFLEERGWYIGTRRVRAVVVDPVGGGPIANASFVVGTTQPVFIGTTNENGSFFVDRPCDGLATASITTTRDGTTITDAVSVERPDAEHLELPLRRVLRTALGAFDRHGLVTGTLTNVDLARQQRFRTTRRLELRDWWDDVVEGVPIRSSLPIDVDPVATQSTFTVGVDRVGGHLSAAEVTLSSGVTTLHKVGVLADLVPSEGATISRDVALDQLVPGAVNFTVPQALTNLVPTIAVSTLRLSLALEQPSGRVIDVVRDIGGNHVASSSDLALRLPPLTGQLANHRWRVITTGTVTTPTAGTVTQRTLLSLRGVGVASETPAPFLALPQIQSPSVGSAVAAAGLSVSFTLPTGALYATLELRSTTASDTLQWLVYLRPESTQFTFPTLPSPAVSPLVAGRTYTLTLTAFRASAGPATGGIFDYRGVTTFLQSLGTSERGVDSMSSQSITITTS